MKILTQQKGCAGYTCPYTNLYVFVKLQINLFRYAGAQNGGEK